MKSIKKGKKNINFGFVGAGYNPMASKIIFSTHAKMYLHIIFLENENQYICNGMIRKRRSTNWFKPKSFKEIE